MRQIRQKLHKQEMGDLGEAQVVSYETLTVPKETSQPDPPKQRRRKKPTALVLGVLLFICAGAAISASAKSTEAGNIAVENLTSFSVMLNVNSHPEIISTNCQTVRDLLKEQGIRLTSADYIGMDIDTPLYNGITVWLRLAVPITIIADGKTYQVESQPVTVEEALALAGVSLGEKDETSLPRLSYLYEAETITVSRVTQRKVTEEEEIEQKEHEEEVPYLAAGSRVVVDEGRPGLAVNEYLVTYRDGKEIERVPLSSEISRTPMDRVIGVGTATGSNTAQLETLSDGTSFYYTSSWTAETTAYTWTGSRTASGTWPTVGCIAVDPNVIPLGTQVYIVGYGFATAQDTGGAVKGNIVDLYMNSATECTNWGRRNVTIYILE